MKTIYEINGYTGRPQYLAELAQDYNVDPLFVEATADLLGEAEDFDGLVECVGSMAEGM